MARKVLIQIRRGLETNIGTLVVGELGYCTDTQKLYIGTTGGNVLLVASQTAGDMLKSIYDTNNDGIVDVAEAVPWSGVTGKPGTFPPREHTHAAADIAQNASNRFVTDTEKSAWNGKQNVLSVVSQAEAEAGTATTQRLWTAQRVAQAITSRSMSKGPITWNDLKGV